MSRVSISLRSKLTEWCTYLQPGKGIMIVWYRSVLLQTSDQHCTLVMLCCHSLSSLITICILWDECCSHLDDWISFITPHLLCSALLSDLSMFLKASTVNEYGTQVATLYFPQVFPKSQSFFNMRKDMMNSCVGCKVNSHTFDWTKTHRSVVNTWINKDVKWQQDT